MRKACKILVGIPERKIAFGRLEGNTYLNGA
jgi:hypothetical protein